MLTNPFILSLILAIAFNLFVFLFAYKFQTDKLTDITYATTFALIAIAFFYYYSDTDHIYRMALMAMSVLWAIRLGGYLLKRVITKGSDHRFEDIRPSFKRFCRFFLIQGSSAWVVSLPIIVGLSATTAEADSAMASMLFPIGVAIWAIGFIVETVADYQKNKFRLNPANNGQFFDKGLFSIVRFPNYTGEIMVWFGTWIAAIPVLQGWEWLTIIGPLWISLLLIKVSGIPFLERSNAKRYGDMQTFQAYQKGTRKLFPGIW